MKPETSIVGRRLPPFGAANKVTGAARYVIDVALPGALVGKLLRLLPNALYDRLFAGVSRKPRGVS